MNIIDITQLTEFINKIQQDNTDISVRKLVCENYEIFILYIKQLTDRQGISKYIIKPILEYNCKTSITIQNIADSVIYVDDISIDYDQNKIINYILSGRTIILMPDNNQYIAANTLKVEKRTVQNPQVETSIRAPRDAFTEDINVNIALIRHRLKDPSLQINYFTVGKRTKTSVAVIYIKNIANINYVNEITKKIQSINIDGIVESSYIQKFISNKSSKIFPQVGIAERPDTVCGNILEGKVSIIVDGSNLTLIAPKVLAEFLDTGEDHYENPYLSIFIKILRIFALTLTLTISPLYVAIVAFHPDFIPAQYILALASSRVSVPVNALLEATMMEFISELLREASIRLPKQIGPAIGIVGTIVIGQAAVIAGIVSPLMVIIVSLSSMASFAIPDFTIMNSLRILKFMLLFITGIFGIIGLFLGYTMIIIKLLSTKSFGVPYFSPFAPYNFNDLKKFFLSDVKNSKKRPGFLNVKNQKRQ